MEKPPVITLLNSSEDAAPLPLDIKTVFLGGIFLLLLLTAMHTAGEIVIPVLLAFILKLVLQPLLRILVRHHIPQTLAAGMIIISLTLGTVGMASMLSDPAAAWGDKLTDSYPIVQKRLSFLNKQVQKTQKILVQADDITKSPGSKAMPVVILGTRLSDKIMTGTQSIASGLFTTMLVLFFFLAAGDTFLRRFVEILPRFKDKRQAVDIFQQIEHDISGYLVTITMMNICVGATTALVMQLFHVDDPLLWGALAFLLNYIPIIGPMIGILVFLLVGLMVLGNSWSAFMPGALYMLIHLAEGSAITPMLLAKRFTLNPVLVILSLLFWFWMWGVVGAILAVPMLAITKIICDRIQRLSAFGHFLEG